MLREPYHYTVSKEMFQGAIMSNRSLAKPSSETYVLVTGGAGYIGSHTCVELLSQGYNVVIVDDFSNSSKLALDRIGTITEECSGTFSCIEGDILDRSLLESVFETYDIDAIIHFAGFKAVGESVEKPLEYYWNNVAGTIQLCDVARSHQCKNIVFSSSATVYGEAKEMPISEHTPTSKPTNPYGQSKYMVEQILTDVYLSDNEWNITLLRYFNPIGAHKSGLIGEDPKGIPNNLVPFVAQVAAGKREYVHVWGNDYPTPDGTGVRDYIHVVDLATGHIKALEWMGGKIGSGVQDDLDSITGEQTPEGDRRGVAVFNLGTGTGSSVLEVITEYGRALGSEIPYKLEERRAGDVTVCYAACDKAKRELDWQAKYDLRRMCEDSWRWQSNNPDGYKQY
jgi:UDP-glucose 4-epimerase